MSKLKLTTKLSLINTIATLVVVTLSLTLIYRYFYVLATRSVLADFSNPGRFVNVLETPFGKQYIVLRWDLYVADFDSKEIINDPYGIGFIDREGFVKLGERYFYFSKIQGTIFGKDITSTMTFLENIKRLFITTVFLIALGVFLLTYFLTKRSVSEIKEFISHIESLGGSDVSRRVAMKPKSFEVMELVDKFNNLMDRIERSYKSQESFVSAVSHELRTPVATLLGYVSMLKRWGLKDEKILSESVEAIEESAKEIKQIIENMLLIARVETLTEEEFDLLTFVEDIVSQKVKSDTVEIKGNGKIRTNKEGLGIILTILLDNAFTHGSPPFAIEISDNMICVVNHGEKIPEQLIPKIFDRFFKGKNSNGTGLGLYIASEIAKKLQLKLAVDSTEERTVFKIIKE
ncbi:sensor histidine kinase [Fervidobacterium sp.]